MPLQKLLNGHFQEIGNLAIQNNEWYLSIANCFTYIWNSENISLLTSNFSDVIMKAMASQITSVSMVCFTVCSGADQRNHQSSASLAFVMGMHRWPVNSPHKGPVTRKMFPLRDVIMVKVALAFGHYLPAKIPQFLPLSENVCWLYLIQYCMLKYAIRQISTDRINWQRSFISLPWFYIRCSNLINRPIYLTKYKSDPIWRPRVMWKDPDSYLRSTLKFRTF